jgi:hypothetical protein
MNLCIAIIESLFQQAVVFMPTVSWQQEDLQKNVQEIYTLKNALSYIEAFFFIFDFSFSYISVLF